MIKKPNITEGEWNYYKDNFPEILSSTRAICKGYNCEHGDFTDKEEDTNLKAISAVPEMIDALIEAYHTLKPTVDKYGIHCSGGESETLRDIEQALLKAGCIFDE